jgi:repressor LexA
MEFKDRLKALRKNAGLTQKELCQKSGVSYSYLTKLESGVQVNPTYEVLAALGDVLGVPLAAVYDFNDVHSNYDLFPIESKKVPLLGKIACGKPIYAEEQHDCFVMAGSNINADFCLVAKGDSMTNARIKDGDIVFIRQQPVVDNGEIAAVIIGDEATLKRVYYYPNEGKLILNAENPKYAPLVYIGEELNQIKIVGKAVAFQSMVE